GGASNTQPWTPFLGAWLNSSGSQNGYVMRPDYVAAGLINSVPQSIKFQTQPNPWKIACNVHNAQTGHPGGMNVALADGSSRVVAKTIGNTTWWAAVTPNGHDVLGNDW